MSIDEIHELIYLFSDPNFFSCLNSKSLLDLVDISSFSLGQRGIHMSNDLLSQLLKIIVKFIHSIVCFLLFGFVHIDSLLLQVTLSFVELLLALSARFFVHLVLMVCPVEVEVGIVQDF